MKSFLLKAFLVLTCPIWGLLYCLGIIAADIWNDISRWVDGALK